MTDSESRQQIESTIRTTRLIWLALMAGVAAYAGVTWYLTSTNDMALGGAGIPRVLPVSYTHLAADDRRGVLVAVGGGAV